MNSVPISILSGLYPLIKKSDIEYALPMLPNILTNWKCYEAILIKNGALVQEVPEADKENSSASANKLGLSSEIVADEPASAKRRGVRGQLERPGKAKKTKYDTIKLEKCSIPRIDECEGTDLKTLCDDIKEYTVVIGYLYTIVEALYEEQDLPENLGFSGAQCGLVNIRKFPPILRKPSRARIQCSQDDPFPSIQEEPCNFLKPDSLLLHNDSISSLGEKSLCDEKNKQVGLLDELMIPINEIKKPGRKMKDIKRKNTKNKASAFDAFFESFN